MSKKNPAIIILVFLAVSVSCKSLMPPKTAENGKDQAIKTGKAPVIDFTTPGKPLNVTVHLGDKKQAASGKVSPAGGSVSLTSADGSKFTLDVPANALETETTITMTAVKSIDGAPLDNNTPTAVQLEPSGLFFKEFATLTIVPAKEIPIKEQIIFGYEGDGKDYHLAPVDPKSRDIKIKLMHFSGAGVGSGSDAAWAANLMIQAGNASTMLLQKIGEYTTTARQRILLGGEDSSEVEELLDKAKSALEQFEDEVILKQIAAAELDCKHSAKALNDLLFVERMRQLLGFGSTPRFDDNVQKLLKISNECKPAYRISGNIDDAVQKGDVCNSGVPFTVPGTLNFTFTPSNFTKGTYTYTGPFGAKGSGPYEIFEGGKMEVSGTGCIMGNCDTYSHDWTATPIDPGSCGK